MATNLETLELTISANAASAIQNIDDLSTHLVAMGKAIIEPIKQLTELNRQLGILKGYTNIKLPNLGGSGGSGKGKYKQPGSPISAGEAMRLVNEATDKELLTSKAQGMMSEYMTNATGGMLNQKQLADSAIAIRKVTKAIEESGKEAEKASPKASKLGKVMGQVSRIFQTMVIRTAIRAFIKSFSEAFTNV